MRAAKLQRGALLAAFVVTSSTVVANTAATQYKHALASTQAPEAVEVRSFLTDEWGVPHPAGVSFFPDEGSLLVAEPESEATEVLRLSPFEDALGTLRLPSTSHPATLAFDRARKRLTVLSGSELLTVLAADLRKAQPPVRRIPVPNLGLKSPTGATFDPTTGTWYVLDDGTKTIVRVPMPGGSPGTPARISLQGLGAASLQGLAFNPADQLFYVASPTQNLLYGLDSSGKAQKTYSLNAIELGGVGLQDLRALVFAPSADPTDNPSTQHLFIADAGSTSILGGVAEVSLVEATVASTEQGTLVQTIQTSRFNPPSPDPAGITYLRARDSLEICDSEVDEMTIFRGVNLWQVTRTGTVRDTGATFPHPPNAKEPTGLGFKPADGTLFVSDDNRRRVFLIRPGPDGRYGTSDDQQVGSIDVTRFALPVDAEGVEFDTRSGHVFIADGVGREVWRVNPGPNRTFGNADDIVTHFDVGRFGALDPEGIGHVAARNNLVIVDDPSETVYEVTTSGGLVRTINISGVPGVRRPAGITLARGTNDPARMNLWIVDRVVDNNADPNENDGRLYEISWPSAPPT